MNETFIKVYPVLPSPAVHDLHADLLEVLLIMALRHLSFYLTAMDILLESQQYLVRIDGFDQIIGNLLSNGLLHDVLLFAFRHHNDRGSR